MMILKMIKIKKEIKRITEENENLRLTMEHNKEQITELNNRIEKMKEDIAKYDSELNHKENVFSLMITKLSHTIKFAMGDWGSWYE